MASHYLTSFGYTVDANVFLRAHGGKFFVTLHDYANHDRRFPGIEVEAVDRELRIGGRDLRATPRAALWSQPDEQRFRTRDARVGGLVGLRVDLPARGRYGSYVTAEAKSAGWVAGNEHLDANVSLRVGMTRLLN